MAVYDIMRLREAISEYERVKDNILPSRFWAADNATIRDVVEGDDFRGMLYWVTPPDHPLEFFQRQPIKYDIVKLSAVGFIVIVCEEDIKYDCTFFCELRTVENEPPEKRQVAIWFFNWKLSDWCEEIRPRDVLPPADNAAREARSIMLNDE